MTVGNTRCITEERHRLAINILCSRAGKGQSGASYNGIAIKGIAGAAHGRTAPGHLSQSYIGHRAGGDGIEHILVAIGRVQSYRMDAFLIGQLHPVTYNFVRAFLDLDTGIGGTQRCGSARAIFQTYGG